MKLTCLRRLCISSSDWTLLAAQEIPNTYLALIDIWK